MRRYDTNVTQVSQVRHSPAHEGAVQVTVHKISHLEIKHIIYSFKFYMFNLKSNFRFYVDEPALQLN